MYAQIHHSQRREANVWMQSHPFYSPKGNRFCFYSFSTIALSSITLHLCSSLGHACMQHQRNQEEGCQTRQVCIQQLADVFLSSARIKAKRLQVRRFSRPSGEQ